MPTANGVYKHYADGIPNGISEKWIFSGDTLLLDIVFKTPTYQMTAQVQLDGLARPQSFVYNVDSAMNGSYHIVGNQLIVKRTLPGNTKLDDILVWSDNAILDLPFLSCKGNTILYLEKHGTSPTFAPILQSGDRAGDLAKKSIEHVATEFIQVAGQSYTATNYRYVRDYWLDEQGVVLRGQADSYEMVLTEYKR